MTACGNTDCGVSTGICGELTFGSGTLDPDGYWEIPCETCREANYRRERKQFIKAGMAVAAIKSSPRLGHLHAIIRRELGNAKDGVHANPARWSAAVEMWERLAELFGVRT